ncbi:SecDF P1 head subdomain-containing protein [Anderseniella sp. Alg231-50]|uniref:SecDF P1 head subdomain-containing protein n=1 Tax=Anderseniella sp. Alg231-50 TaxID=1922226 RepID=UPI000D55DC06
MPMPRQSLMQPRLHEVCKAPAQQGTSPLPNGAIELVDIYGNPIIIFENPIYQDRWVEDARICLDKQRGEYAVHVFLTHAGADWMSEYTLDTIGKQVAIVGAGRVFCAPHVFEHHPSGSLQINTGNDLSDAKIVWAGLLGRDDHSMQKTGSTGCGEPGSGVVTDPSKIEELKTKHDEQALRYLDQKIATDNGNLPALRRRAHLLQSKLVHGAAIADLDKIVESHPTDLNAICQRARTKLEAEDSLGAVTDFEFALSNGVDREIIAEELAGAYCNAGLYNKALSEYTRLFNAWSDTPMMQAGYLFERGQVFTDLGRHDDAMSDFTNALELFPAPRDEKQVDFASLSFISQVWNAMAWCQLETKEFDAALQSSNRSLQFDPKNSDALDTRGHVQLRLKKYSLAIADFQSALAIDPELCESQEGLNVAIRRLPE